MSNKDFNPELVEGAKRKASYQAVAEHFDKSFKYVGIGSGSTIRYVVDAIKAQCDNSDQSTTLFVPTGSGSRQMVRDSGLTPIDFESLPEGQMLDVAFDGADECDEDFNLIKGGGACLFQEKLVATRARKFVAVADFRKDVARLLTNWAYIPVEVAPIALAPVLKSLRALGSLNPSLRTTVVADQKQPLKTDQGFYIVMAPFRPLLLKSDSPSASNGQAKAWEVSTLAKEIKNICGVLEVGLFFGHNGPEASSNDLCSGQKPVAVYFGMPDGTVKTRNAASTS